MQHKKNAALLNVLKDFALAYNCIFRSFAVRNVDLRQFNEFRNSNSVIFGLKATAATQNQVIMIYLEFSVVFCEPIA